MAASLTDPPVHGFTSYNKPSANKQPDTLIGNWQEERELKGTTGNSRYQTWTEKDMNQSIYGTKQDQASSNMETFPRVIEHLEQVAPPNWVTMQQVSYTNPKSTPHLMTYSSKPGVGRREQMELAALMAEAAQLPPQVEATLTGHPLPPQMETTYQAHYLETDLTGMEIGAHIMKDRDGRPAVRDPTFLAETQLVPKALGDRVFGEAAIASGATQTVHLPDPDVPITIYTEAVATRKYTGTVYGTRPVAGQLPFNKNTNFSKPMSEYNKVVVDE